MPSTPYSECSAVVQALMKSGPPETMIGPAPSSKVTTKVAVRTHNCFPDIILVKDDSGGASIGTNDTLKATAEALDSWDGFFVRWEVLEWMNGDTGVEPNFYDMTEWPPDIPSGWPT